MSIEQEPEYFERSHVDYEKRVAQLLDGIVAVSERPGEEIQIEADLYRAFMAVYQAEPELQGLVDSLVRLRTDMTPTHHRYMIRSTLQKAAFQQHHDYPNGVNEATWHSLIMSVVDNEAMMDEVKDDLFHLHLKTNVPERYKSIPVLAHWMRANGRVGEEVSILDEGCSRNLGLKTLAFIENSNLLRFAFKNTVVVEPSDHHDIASAKIRRPDEIKTEAVLELQNGAFGLARGLGRDLEDLDDPAVQRWTLANLTPRDHQDGTANLQELLDSAYNFNGHDIHPKITFERQDLLASSFEEVADKFDIVTLFTVLNQMSEEQRTVAIRSARRNLKPTGILVVQDFARVNEDAPTRLVFLDDQWNKGFSYRTTIYDMMRPYRFQEVMRWNGGRPKEVNIPFIDGLEPMITPANKCRAVGLRTFLGGSALRS